MEGIDDRNAAERIRGFEIAVGREELPPTNEEANEFYWRDLIGLSVVGQTGELLGQVAGLLETGSQDVLRVTGDRERLIPFVAPIIQTVDRENGRIVVNWGVDW